MGKRTALPEDFQGGSVLDSISALATFCLKQGNNALRSAGSEPSSTKLLAGLKSKLLLVAKDVSDAKAAAKASLSAADHRVFVRKFTTW